MQFPGPGTARRKQQLASGRVRDFVLLCRCCVVTYVRGPDYTAGLHFSNKAQVGEFQLGLVCVGVGISGGNLNRPPAQLESAVGPLLFPILQISLVRRDREGDLRFSEEAHPRGGGRVVVTGIEVGSWRRSG